MPKDVWKKLLLPQGNEAHLWGLFNEAAKLSVIQTREIAGGATSAAPEQPPLGGAGAIALAPPSTLKGMGVEESMLTRISERDFSLESVGFHHLSTILRLAFAGSERAPGTAAARIYLHSAKVEGLPSGIYRHDSRAHSLIPIRSGDLTETIADSTIQQDIALRASLLMFIAVRFDAIVSTHGERAYRLALMAAGRVAQRINLLANAVGWGCLNMGGYIDRDIDRLLELDGVTTSTLYMVALGPHQERGRSSAAENKMKW